MEHFTTQIFDTTWLEWIAFLFGVAQVWLALLNRIDNFWAGLVSVVIYTYLFYENGLYAESALNLYYILISIWGLVLWSKRKTDTPLISFCTIRFFLATCGFVFIIWLLLYFVLTKHTNSSVPIWDALVSSLAWGGSWLLLRRKIENWLFLTLSNFIAIPLQWHKEMELTAMLTILYLIVGIAGYIKWKKEYYGSKPSISNKK